MFHFTPGHFVFERLGLLLLMVQLALFVFGLPPFHLGIWLQTEPDMLALYLFGVCNALWLFYGVARGALVQKQRAPVLWFVLLAWVGWQILVTCFAFTPYRSWFGPVEMGEGVAWHMCLVLIAALAHPLWQVRQWRNVLLIWAATVISVESLLHVLFNARDNKYVPGVWTPAQWGAYLAFMVGYFWVMVMAAGYIRSMALYIVLMVFTFDVTIISYNKTAIILLPFALGTSFLMYLRQRGKGEDTLPGRKQQIVAAALCFLPVVWIAFAALYVPPKEDVEHYGVFNLSHKDSALGSRIGLIQVGLRAMENEPRRWLIGDGWGEFNDSMFRYALVRGVHLFKDGERNTNWSFVDGNAYHSHSQPLEALLALGVPGMLLWFAIGIAMIFALPPRLFWPCVPMLLLVNTIAVAPCLLKRRYLPQQLRRMLPY